MESLPLILIAVAMLLMIIVWAGFSEFGVFIQFNQKKDFKEGISALVQQMKLIKAGSSGSFYTQSLKAPGNYNLSFDLDSNMITGQMPDEIYNVSLTLANINITGMKNNNQTFSRNGTVLFEGGNIYTFVLYYGTLQENQTTGTMIVFE